MNKLSLQWRLTLMTAALAAGACLLLNLFISHSAVSGIQEIENYVIAISPDGQDEFLLDIETFYPDLQNQLRQTTDAFRLRSSLATVMVILLSSILTRFLSGRALSPLKTFSAHMETIQAQNLSQPLEVPDSGDEIARLTRSFNGMLERLHDAFTAQQQFCANAAHELRTPLTVMRTRLDLLQKKKTPSLEEYAQTLQSVSEQTERLSRRVKVLLEITGLETARRSDHISLSALAEEVLCDLAQVAEDKKVTLTQDEGEAKLNGSDLLIYRAVYNLVENAIKYNRPGGTVRVSARMENEMAVLEVTDTGIGIAPENRESIFDPFVRVDKSRSRAMGGAGLGLTLVRDIARLHGGSVRVAQSSPQGTQIVLALPAAAPEQ